jgi:hypothetical protein
MKGTTKSQSSPCMMPSRFETYKLKPIITPYYHLIPSWARSSSTRKMTVAMFKALVGLINGASLSIAAVKCCKTCYEWRGQQLVSRYTTENKALTYRCAAPAASSFEHWLSISESAAQPISFLYYVSLVPANLLVNIFPVCKVHTLN